MNSGVIICPQCKSYQHCQEMGYADAVECKNFDKDDSTMFAIYDTSDVVAIGKIDDTNPLSNTLQIDGCERIILRDKTLEFQFEIGRDQYRNIDTIVVNGVTFKKQ